MQLYAREQLAYPAAEVLDHKEPQGVELHPLDSRGHQLAPQHIQESIGRCMQQQPELLGKKTLAAEALGFEMPLEESQVRAPSEVSLPPSKVASSARDVRVSNRILLVAQSSTREPPQAMVESSNNPTIAGQAPSLQLPS
jgi:hypothetical protein